jgi:hypothetical protein
MAPLGIRAMTRASEPNPLRVGFMPRGRRFTLYAVALSVWGSGCVWLLLHYFTHSVDRLGFETPHPAEKWVLIAHAFASFYAMWWFGVLWTGHIKRGWNSRIRRGTGGTLFGFWLWLAVTGYALYYVVSDTWRDRTSILHWTVGLIALGAFLVHLYVHRSRPRPHTRR